MNFKQYLVLRKLSKQKLMNASDIGKTFKDLKNTEWIEFNKNGGPINTPDKRTVFFPLYRITTKGKIEMHNYIVGVITLFATIIAAVTGIISLLLH